MVYELNSFELSGALQKTIDSIREFANEMLQSNHDEIKSTSLSLLVTIGLLCGSVKLIVEAIDSMMKNNIVLNMKVLSMLKKCAEWDPDFNIAFPNNKV